MPRRRIARGRRQLKLGEKSDQDQVLCELRAVERRLGRAIRTVDNKVHSLHKAVGQQVSVTTGLLGAVAVLVLLAAAKDTAVFIVASAIVAAIFARFYQK